MEYILLAAIVFSIIINFFISKYFVSKISKLFSVYRTEMFQFSKTQKQNTEKLVELLNKLFVLDDKQSRPEPNEVTKPDPEEIQFAEENPLNIPADVKFEVEGGDTFIPPGYNQQKPN